LNSNSENPRIGRGFQVMSAKKLSELFNVGFALELPLPIGSPGKNHKFDCVSEDKRIVVECKCYTWTDTGNVPSAKMAALNEAVFYLHFLHESTKKIVVLKKSVCRTKRETLAEYYNRINNHLLGDIGIYEIDETDELTHLRVIRECGQNHTDISENHSEQVLTINTLWHSRSSTDWQRTLDSYWNHLSFKNISVEKELEMIDSNEISAMSAVQFYEFLHDKYFVWKYTAANRLATSRKHLERYVDENRMNELEWIHRNLFSFDLADISLGLRIAMNIRGLGSAGASGLLAILFPEYFGTIDQFVVTALCSIEGLEENSRLAAMKPENLTEKDGVVIISILRNKAAVLNKEFATTQWTPRKIDKILWSIGR